MPRHPFPKSRRLLKRSDYKEALAYGKKYYTKHFIVFIYPHSLAFNRLGLILSHKAGNAVVRNRVKRLLRENFRLDNETITKSLPKHDVVFIGKKGLKRTLKLQDVEKDCLELYEKHSSFIDSNVPTQPLSATA